MTTLRAGAGAAPIEFPDGIFSIDGFVGVHDPIHVRAAVFEGPDGLRHVICSLELPSLRDDALDRLRDRICRVAGVAGTDVWISVTHTLSAPHTRSAQALADPDVARRNDLFCAALDAACARAVAQAVETLRDALVGAATTSEPLNVNRDIDGPGGWTTGANPDRFSDHTLGVIRVDALDGAPIVLLYNFDVRSSLTEAAGDALVSADGTGAASRALEDALGGVAIFLPGAMGDQAPDLSGLPDASGAAYAASTAWGAALADAVLATARVADLTVCGLHAARASFRYPGVDGERTLDLDLLVLGGAALVALRPELTSGIGSRVRLGSPWPVTFVCTMVNGGAKYLADDEAHALGTWAATHSAFGPGAADAVVDASLDLLTAQTLRSAS
ncbi:MAG: hypothetical protein QM779_01755 [Propionicimonas sp.]|uniref:hypothetical protein n=1 Tax=Propionicimonas sp. TaxID=1955623 RepID=UPI003D0F5A9C